jgi:hypothetical protein
MGKNGILVVNGKEYQVEGRLLTIFLRLLLVMKEINSEEKVKIEIDCSGKQIKPTIKKWV